MRVSSPSGSLPLPIPWEITIQPNQHLCHQISLKMGMFWKKAPFSFGVALFALHQCSLTNSSVYPFQTLADSESALFHIQWGLYPDELWRFLPYLLSRMQSFEIAVLLLSSSLCFRHARASGGHEPISASCC